MSPEEQKQFRYDYFTIKRQKDLISQNSCRIRRISVLDKHGDREGAIRGCEQRAIALESELSAMLKGKSWEYWHDFHNELRALNRSLERVQNKIEKLKF